METKRLIETENSIQEFTVQFYGGTVMIEQNQLPLGQISCELLDYPVEELLALHDEAVRLFSIVRDSLFARDKEKSPALAAAVQRQLNRALKHVYPLPLFSLLNIDRDTYGTMLEELCRSAPDAFRKVHSCTNRKSSLPAAPSVITISNAALTRLASSTAFCPAACQITRKRIASVCAVMSASSQKTGK